MQSIGAQKLVSKVMLSANVSTDKSYAEAKKQAACSSLRIPALPWDDRPSCCHWALAALATMPL